MLRDYAEDGVARIFGALQGQLGPEARARKEVVKKLAVVRVERPLENWWPSCGLKSISQSNRAVSRRMRRCGQFDCSTLSESLASGQCNVIRS